MITLTDEQQAAVDMALTSKVSILTGGPGTGKTTTCKEIIERYKSTGATFAICAPSGKAAKRISEATDYPASTIHKLLEAQGDNGEFSFGRSEMFPLEERFIIMDETSMVSCDLMADFLRAIDTDKTRVLFVGDQDQLPSIGPGACLRDFLASKAIPHINLNKIHRNSGDIVASCHLIKDGKYYVPSDTLDVTQGKNLRHLEVARQSKILRMIVELVAHRMPTRGYDPLTDIQVISPTNSRTDISCDAINKALQNELNKNPVIEGSIFRVNDKIINIKNRSIGNEYVVNGDIGRVVEIFEDKKNMTVKFFDPDRVVEIRKNDNEILLAYAITCHRAQGSEAPVVIIPVHSAFTFFLNRPWIYTAISRAKEICLTIGELSAIWRAIDRPGNARETRLKGLLSRNFTASS